MKKQIKNTNFLLHNDVMGWILEHEIEQADGNVPNGSELTFAVIEQPFHCTISYQEEFAQINLYIRNEMGVFLEMPNIGVKIPSDGSEPEITASSGGIGNEMETISIFFQIGWLLLNYLSEKGALENYINLDVETEAVVVDVVNDELVFEKVTGKARPDLACTTLFGGVEMRRSYQDEIFNSWGVEMLSFDEKLEMAENGDETAMDQVAMIYMNGDEDEEIEQDFEKAVYWFRKMAESGMPNGMFNLGLHYGKGCGVERDFEQAVYWMEQAAENGDEDAPALIEKFKKAVNAEKIIETGDAQAQADLAEVYMFMGNSLDQENKEEDYAIAFDYAKKSAEQNNGDGLWALALAYQHGRGVDEDVDKAIELYRKGAELGHAPSQHSLACYLMRGDHLDADPETAFSLFEKSALQGYKLAEFSLCKMYELGEGTEQDLDKAIEWGEKAATGGDADTQYEVAKLYTYTNDDGMIDAERAKYWYSQAAEKGHEMAASILNFGPFWGEEDFDDEDFEF